MEDRGLIAGRVCHLSSACRCMGSRDDPSTSIIRCMGMESEARRLHEIYERLFGVFKWTLGGKTIMYHFHIWFPDWRTCTMS